MQGWQHYVGVVLLKMGLVNLENHEEGGLSANTEARSQLEVS